MPSEATERSGRLHSVMIHKSGNLPFCWYRTVSISLFGSRGIDRTVSDSSIRQGLFAMPFPDLYDSDFGRGFFICDPYPFTYERMDYIYEKY